MAEPTPRRRTAVPELTGPAASEHASLYRTKAFPFVSEGTVYCFGLREYLVEPSMPRGEQAIAALLALPAGAVFGVTCGARAHLFYFHNAFGVTHVGPLGEGAANGGALLALDDHHLVGGWWGPEGGGLFRHDATAASGQGMEQFRGNKAAIEPLALPRGVGGVAALAGPLAGIVYALGAPGGELLAVDAKSGKTQVLARIAGAAPALVVLADGTLLGAYGEGRLWRYAPVEGQLTALEAQAPCQKGKRYVASVQCLLAAGDGLVYGGTGTDGFLFSFCPETGRVVNLGKPNRQSNLRALCEGLDGRLYGLVEEQGGLAHLFRFDPETRGLTDLGIVGSSFPEHWIAHCLGALSVGVNGEVYIGETDALSHLFIYHPPVGRRG